MDYETENMDVERLLAGFLRSLLEEQAGSSVQAPSEESVTEKPLKEAVQ